MESPDPRAKLSAIRVSPSLLDNTSPGGRGWERGEEVNQEVDLERLACRRRRVKAPGASDDAGVVEGTVKIHVANIFGKLDVSDRTEAVIEAIKRGLVHIE